MKYLIFVLFLFSAYASSQSFWISLPADKYADETEKAKIDYRRALKECKVMAPKEKAACQKRTESTWRDVQKGLKAQHLGNKT